MCFCFDPISFHKFCLSSHFHSHTAMMQIDVLLFLTFVIWLSYSFLLILYFSSCSYLNHYGHPICITNAFYLCGVTVVFYFESIFSHNFLLLTLFFITMPLFSPQSIGLSCRGLLMLVRSMRGLMSLCLAMV